MILSQALRLRINLTFSSFLVYVHRTPRRKSIVFNTYIGKLASELLHWTKFYLNTVINLILFLLEKCPDYIQQNKFRISQVNNDKSHYIDKTKAVSGFNNNYYRISLHWHETKTVSITYHIELSCSYIKKTFH